MLNNYQSSRTSVSYVDDSSVSNTISTVPPRFLKFQGRKGRPTIININNISAVYWSYDENGYVVERTDGMRFECTEDVDSLFNRLDAMIGQNTQTNNPES